MRATSFGVRRRRFVVASSDLGERLLESGQPLPGDRLQRSGRAGSGARGQHRPPGLQGHVQFDASEVFDEGNPRVFHVTSIQFFGFDDGRVLVTDGLGGGWEVLRAIVAVHPAREFEAMCAEPGNSGDKPFKREELYDERLNRYAPR